MKKMHVYASVCLALTGATGSVSAVTYYDDNFDARTNPFDPPPIGHHVSTTGSAGPHQFALVTDPVKSGQALRIQRESPDTAPVYGMWGNDGAMVDGNVIEMSFDVNTSVIGNAPIQVQAGMQNGGAGRLLFFGVTDKHTVPTDVGRVFYTDLFGNQVITPYKIQPNTWYNFKAVMTLVPDPSFPEYMTGTWDYFVTKDGDETQQLVDDVQMSYGQIPNDNPDTIGWDESTAPFLRISKGPFSGNTYYENIFIGQPSVGLIGDANLDGIVDTQDFNILAGHFGLSGQTSATGDFSGDGTVDSTDFDLLVAHYGQTAGPAAALGAVVPEPATAICLLPALLLKRRRATH